ncbi:hypothetical protein KJ865_15255, partial [Myxococcota bacterium]|nr:hypothetical protein [Myxococcota bacterium]
MKWSALLLTLLILPSCSEKSGESITRTKENTVVVGWSKGVVTLDPACADGFESAEVASHIYEGLVSINVKTGDPVPHLATSWRSDIGGLVWDFAIRKGIRFHDGTPLDAEAVAFSFQRQIDATQSNGTDKPIGGTCSFNYWNAYFGMIKSVRAIDKWNVRFKLKHRYSPFLYSLELFSVAIVKPFDPIKDPQAREKLPIGTGPFKFVSNNEERTVLIRNDTYWKKEDRAEFQYLEFRTIPDSSQRLLALKGGTIDIAHQVDPDKLLMLNLHPFLNIKFIKSVNVVYVALNTRIKPFSIKQNRIGANHALNRDKIIKLVYQGLGEVGNAPFPPFLTMGGKPIYTKNAPLDTWYKYSRTLARQMLEEGGYLDGKGNKQLKLYLIRAPRNTLPAPLLMANLIKNDFARLGIDVQIFALPYNEYKAAIRNGKHHMAIHAWIGDMWDPDNFLYGLLHSNTGTNYANFNNREYDKYVEKGRSEIKQI